jgi:hypothetical protein
VCGDIRPFSILDDTGLRNLAQECIRIGKKSLTFIPYINDCLSMYILGSTYGTVDINDVLRGERTISRHIISVADDLRDKVKEMISIPLKERSLTISPDYWMDSYKKISYLAVTITIVTYEYVYQSIDLFCRPFEHKKKSAELTLDVSPLTFYCKIIAIQMAFLHIPFSRF